MKLLIDTHVLVWATTATGLLPDRVTDLISDVTNDILVSAVSAYEIEFKRARDVRLQRMPSDLNEAIRRQGFLWLDVSWRHTRTAGRLPVHHRDPWDRILVAQALEEGIGLISVDRRLAAYPVTILW